MKTVKEALDISKLRKQSSKKWKSYISPGLQCTSMLCIALGNDFGEFLNENIIHDIFDYILMYIHFKH